MTMTRSYPLAAIVYRDDEGIDRLIADFCHDLKARGVPVGGVLQRNVRRADGKRDMSLIDLVTGDTFSISQALGAQSRACCINPSGVAQASGVLRQALADRVALAVTNRFGELEVTGGGFAAEMAALIAADIPLITAVAEKNLASWRVFSGAFGTVLPAQRTALDAWFADVQHAALSGAAP